MDIMRELLSIDTICDIYRWYNRSSCKVLGFLSYTGWIMPTPADREDLKKQFLLNYIDYNYHNVNSIITGYIVQILFLFLIGRNPFCSMQDVAFLTLIGKRGSDNDLSKYSKNT